MLQIRNFIDGRHVEPASGRYLDKIDPATGQVCSLVADSEERDVDDDLLDAGRDIVDL